jgi:hypothetical protein
MKTVCVCVTEKERERESGVSFNDAANFYEIASTVSE